MAYSDFTIKKAQAAFQINLIEQSGLFSTIPPCAISAHLQETLAENAPLAVSINTEKARSELIIAPVLVELRKQFHHRISLFSGVELTVDKDLTGFCDFIISHSPEQFFLKSPLIVVVEAKNENMMNGLGQCIAELIAAQRYNEKEGNAIAGVYGVVTSGNLWKFIKLAGDTAYLDLDDYGIKEITRIIGILGAMVEQTA
jgi:hypothetical protein